MATRRCSRDSRTSSSRESGTSRCSRIPRVSTSCWPGYCGTFGSSASASGHDERDVVVLLVGAEGADLPHQRRKEGLARAGAVPAESVHETLLAELLPGLVEGFRDPVGVEGEEVVGLELALPHRALPLPKEPEDRRGRLQPVGAQAQEVVVVAAHRLGGNAGARVVE